MAGPNISIWKKMPFIKLLLPLMAGIVIQWYLQLTLPLWLLIFTGSFIIYISFFFLPLFNRYKLSAINGITSSFIFASIGAVLVWSSDIRNNNQWFSKPTNKNSGFIVTLTENPVEKAKSFKANG